jgi:hypothetical protein
VIAMMRYALIGLMIAVVACSSSTTPKLPKPTAQSIAGTYTLDTIAFVTPTTGEEFMSPYVRGSLVLTQTNYHVYVVIDTSSSGIAADTVVVRSDSGTYTISDSTMIEQSASGGQSSVVVAFDGSVNALRQSIRPAAQVDSTYDWERSP